MISAQTTIQKILNASETYYEIPNFQRPYAWQTANALEFLSDLEESVEKRKNHYFGTVVLVEDTASSYSVAIIDGQQRVTTSLLMVTAIYHLVKNDPSLIDNPETTPELIRDRYLFNANIDKNKVKLRTVTTDNQILQRIFDVNGDEEQLKKIDPMAHLSNLYQVYLTFRKYFSSRTGLDKYIDGLRSFEVISITLNSNDDSPQRVFESINSTGKPLTDGDKIRNFALMLKNDSLRNHVYDNYWSQIERSLVDATKDHITDFFRTYIISNRRTIVRIDTVYPEFKKLFAKHVGIEQEKEKIDAFYGDIIESLGFYEILKIRDTKDFEPQYRGISESVYKLRYLQIDIHIPFTMNILRHHAAENITTEQLNIIFELIVTYLSRRIVCGIGTTSVDAFMATLHREVLSYLKDEHETDYVEVLKYVLLNRIGQTRMPDDAEYTNSILTREAYYQKNSFLLYVLASANGNSKEMTNILHQVSDGQLKLSIEHIMPQTLTSKDWQAMLGDDYERVHSDYLHTLANLTLTGYNSEYSNRPFSEKMHLEVKDKKTGEVEKVGFADSKLTINKWIAEQDTWNEEVLKARQKWWIKKLKAIWQMPTTTYHPVIEDASVDLLDEQDLKGRSIKSIEIFGYKNSVTSWADALDAVSEAIYERHKDNFFEVINNDEWLSQNIKQDNSNWGNSREIVDTGYFIYTATNTNSKLFFIRKLGEVFGLTEGDIVAELVSMRDSEDEEE